MLGTLLALTWLAPSRVEADGLTFEKNKVGENFVYTVSNPSLFPYTLSTCYQDDSHAMIFDVAPESDKDVVSISTLDVGYQRIPKLKHVFKLGDRHARHLSSIRYCLPFEKGSRVTVGQGYNGTFSHQHQFKFSVDFFVPTGTLVCAARAGRVAEVEVTSNLGGETMAFVPFTNYIKICHLDGTVANYAHLKEKCSLVSVGDEVVEGMPIAYSGNTGFSSTPHLHFDVHRPLDGHEVTTIKVRFRIFGDPNYLPRQDDVCTVE